MVQEANLLISIFFLYLLDFRQSRIEMDYSAPDHSRRLVFFLSAVALLGGGSIYLFLRPGDLVFHNWIRAAGLDGYTPPGHYSTLWIRHFPEWFIYSLPGGLWAFAYALIINGIWWESHSLRKYFWMATVPVLVIGFELLQGAGLLRGTFCFTDLALGIVGLGLGMVFCMSLLKKKPHENML
jgi:hypothetical protein